MASCIDNETENILVAVKEIYTSCDPDNTDNVQVSKLIEYMSPYLQPDPFALDSLKLSLDPSDKNICLSRERFYELMNEWTKQLLSNVSDENEDLNQTSNRLNVLDNKDLPYNHSTPRESFGQKILGCEGILNFSNISSYSLTNGSITDGKEKTILEEEIRKLEHQLHKSSNDLNALKLQLAISEEQNEILQAELERCKVRLQSEQKVIEHLHIENRYIDESRDELRTAKQKAEESAKKTAICEKEIEYLNGVIKNNEKQISELEKKCEAMTKREQKIEKEMLELECKLEEKYQEMAAVLKTQEEINQKLNRQKDQIDQLLNENEHLSNQKQTLEKTLREANAFSPHNSAAFRTSLGDISHLVNLGNSIVPFYSVSKGFKAVHVHENSDCCDCARLTEKCKNVVQDGSGDEEVFIKAVKAEAIIDHHISLGEEIRRASLSNLSANELKEKIFGRDKNQAIIKDNEILREEILALKEENKEIKEKLKRNLLENETQTKVYEEKVKKMFEENEKANEKIKENEVLIENYKLNEISKNKADQFGNFTDADSGISEAGSSTMSLEKLPSRKNTSYDKLKLSLERMKEKIEDLEERLRIERRKNGELNKNNNDLEKQQELTVAELKIVLSERNKLQTRIKTLSNRLCGKEEEFKTIDQLKSEVAELNERIENVDVEKQEAINNLKEKEEIVKRLLVENNNCHVSVEEAKKKIAILSSKLTRKQNKLHSVNENIVRKELEIHFLNSKIKESDIKLSQSFLEMAEKDLTISNLEEELKASRDKQDVLLKSKLNEIKEVLFSSRITLCGAAMIVYQNWKTEFEENFCFVNYSESTITIDDELATFKNVLCWVVTLLEFLSNKAPRDKSTEMEELKSRISASCESLKMEEHKTIKKFTLRPAKLMVSRPVSPDSPSLMVEIDHSEPKLKIDKTDLEDSNDEFIFSKLVKKEPKELAPNQKSFPNLSDSFLETLRLKFSSPKKTPSKFETENVFATFAVKVALDAGNIKERMKIQEERCNQQTEMFMLLVKDISLRLRDHRCIGASDPINSVFVLLEDVKFTFREMSESVRQCGMLRAEDKMLNCWNLVTNRMAAIKQDLEQHQLRALQKQQRHSKKESLLKSELGEKVKKDQNLDQLSATKSPKKRNRWLPTTKITVTFITVLSLAILLACIIIHWRCRVTSSNYQVCPLDDFIRKIQVGDPPY